MFAMYGNDPNALAECIARPHLVDAALKTQLNQLDAIQQPIKAIAEQEWAASQQGGKAPVSGQLGGAADAGNSHHSYLFYIKGGLR